MNSKKTNSTSFWSGKRVLITGNTGFKGSWLSVCLKSLGAEVFGYSLAPSTKPSMFELLNLKSLFHTFIADIRNLSSLKNVVLEVKPEVIFHLAAQPLVRYSYENPIETYETNVIGTANLFEAVRVSPHSSVRSIVIVTTDKCYENKEWCWGYREDEALGGYDPYSSSKAACELVTASYRSSYFNPNKYHEHKLGIASARAGNVIGGGDWSSDRLIPDIIRSFEKKELVRIRNPSAVRPWQHVLEPLAGYLNLAEKLYDEGKLYSEAYNFGPNAEDAKNVLWITKKISELWPEKGKWVVEENEKNPHEAHYLKLDISKAATKLNWYPKWNLETALKNTVDWYDKCLSGANMFSESEKQILKYFD